MQPQTQASPEKGTAMPHDFPLTGWGSAGHKLTFYTSGFGRETTSLWFSSARKECQVWVGRPAGGPTLTQRHSHHKGASGPRGHCGHTPRRRWGLPPPPLRFWHSPLESGDRQALLLLRVAGGPPPSPDTRGSAVSPEQTSWLLQTYPCSMDPGFQTNKHTAT